MAAAHSITKTCRRCNVEKLSAEFRKEPRHRDGLASHCRECGRATARAWKERNRDRVLRYAKDYAREHKEAINARERARYVPKPPRQKPPAPTHRRCSRCGILKELLEFHKDSSKGDGISNSCKECAVARANDWYKANRERAAATRSAYYVANAEAVRLMQRRWCAANSERAAALKRLRRARVSGAEGWHTAEDIRRIRLVQKDRCAVCRMALRGKGHVDHIIPIVLGGSNWPKNLQLLCAQCNMKKNRKHPIDFMRSRGFLL